MYLLHNKTVNQWWILKDQNTMLNIELLNHPDTYKQTSEQIWSIASMYTTDDNQAFFGIVFKDHDQNKALNYGVSVELLLLDSRWMISIAISSYSICMMIMLHCHGVLKFWCVLGKAVSISCEPSWPVVCRFLVNANWHSKLWNSERSEVSYSW